MTQFTDVGQGIGPKGIISINRNSGQISATNVPLAANAQFSTGYLPRDIYLGAEIILYSDVAGSYTIEYSDDEGVTLSMPLVSVPYTQIGQTRKGAFDISASWVRITYINGPMPQTNFKFDLQFLMQSAQVSMETLNATGADSRFAMWTKSRLETKDGDAGTYAPIYRTGNALNVSADNGAAGTGISQPSGGTGLLGMVSKVANLLSNALTFNLPSGAATATNQTTMQTTLGSIDGKLPSLGQRLSASSLSITPATDSVFPIKSQGSSTVNTTRIASTASSTTLLASNSSRKGFSITPEGTLYVRFGSGASLTNYDVKMVSGWLYENKPDVLYSGIITSYGVSNVQVSEYV